MCVCIEGGGRDSDRSFSHLSFDVDHFFDAEVAEGGGDDVGW